MFNLIDSNRVTMVFKKGQSGNPNGRGPNILNNAMQKLTREELEDIANVIIKGKREDLKKVLEDKNSSVIKLMFASSVMRIMKEGDTDGLDKILNRLIGKVKDTLDVNGSGLVPTTVVLKLPDNGRASKDNEATS